MNLVHSKTIPSYGLVLFMLPLSSLAGEEFPYQAVVNFRANVRSGPGADYYVTSELKAKSSVEVYQHDGDWLGIRPLTESFSWVRGDHIQVDGNNRVGKVVSENAKAWIGSHVETVQNYSHQVVLDAGESVRVLERKVVTSTGGAVETWYKISPPSGEFRWVHKRHVGSRTALHQTVEEPITSPITPVKQVDKASFQAIQASAFESTGNGRTGFHDVQIQDEGLSADRPVFRQPRQTAGQQKPSKDREQVVAPQEMPPEREDSDERVAEPRRLANEESGLANAATELDARVAEFDTQLRSLDIELSKLVSRDLREWKFAELRQRIRTLIQRGETPYERGRARLLLEQLEEFADHKSARNNPPVDDQAARFSKEDPEEVQQVGLVEDLPSDQPIGSGLRPVDEPVRLKPVPNAVDQTTYDGRGWLVPVVASTKHAPRYAITDQDRQVLAFITPALGMNLHRYLKKQIGVYGQKSTLPGVKRPHITVHRVVDLERHLLR